MTAHLGVELAGVSLQTPLIVSAGPLTRDVRAIQRLADHGGIGAVVLKTIYQERADTPRPYMAAVSNSLLNYDWSAPGIDDWTEASFGQLRDLGLPVIASILDEDDDVLTAMAVKLERLGAAMLEVPTGGVKTAERARERVSAVRSAVDIPISFKIGSTLPDLEAWVDSLEDGGADAITAINTIGPGLVVDTETGKPLIGNIRGRGYLSGPALLPLALRTVADVAALTDLPVMAVGGVTNVEGAVQMLMVGAHAIQMHTAGILKGLQVFGAVSGRLEKYLEERQLASPASLRGISQLYLTAERSWSRFLPELDREACIHCGRCARVCVYEAVEMVDRLPRFQASNCHSCGLCISICPTHALAPEEL